MKISDFKIYIDPGHGTFDPGATAGGVAEFDINFAVATRLKNILKSWGCTIKMKDVTDTQFKDASKICKDSNKWGADIFVSIHCNAGGGTGTETYTARNYSDYEDDLANLVQDAVVKTYGRANRGVKRKDYDVLKNNNAWAILTELLFIDNDADRALLANENKQDKVARAIADAIDSFVYKNFHNIPS